MQNHNGNQKKKRIKPVRMINDSSRRNMHTVANNNAPLCTIISYSRTFLQIIQIFGGIIYLNSSEFCNCIHMLLFLHSSLPFACLFADYQPFWVKSTYFFYFFSFFSFFFVLVVLIFRMFSCLEL